LFIDIVQNYKEVKNFRNYLKDISELAEDLDTKSIHTQWNDFKVVFGQYEKLMENCIVSQIFANCISEDIDELIMSFQLLITEYVMVEYSAFLNIKKEMDYNVIRDYIVIYSRIIGYNADGIKEFWEESFDEAVWDFGYTLLLLN
jgi:lysine-N-methylase